MVAPVVILGEGKTLVHLLLGDDGTVLVEGGGYITPSLVIKIGTTETTIYPDGELSTKHLDFADAFLAAAQEWRDALHGWSASVRDRPQTADVDREDPGDATLLS